MASSCEKCGEKKASQARQSVCDLRPMSGYQTPCAVKRRNGELDYDDLPGNVTSIVGKKSKK